MKQGETLALNERIMLSLVSTGVSSGSAPQACRIKIRDRKASAPYLRLSLSVGLPLHRVYDVCLPHPRQALFHPGPHER